MRAPLLLGAVAFIGCHQIPPPYAVVPNGGLHPGGEVCEDANLRVAGDSVEILERGKWKCPGEVSVRQPLLTATYGYWRTTSSAGLVGPAPSNRVLLNLLPRVAAGQSDKAIADAGSARALEDGSRSKQLADDGNAKRLADDGNARRLADDERRRRLAEDQREKKLGAGQKALALADGGAAKPVIQIAKRFLVPHVFEGNDGRFEIEVRHIGTDTIVHLAIVDRVDPRLQVETPAAAKSTKLGDGSTLLLFEEREAFNPGQTRRYEVHFQVPFREPQ